MRKLGAAAIAALAGYGTTTTAEPGGDIMRRLILGLVRIKRHPDQARDLVHFRSIDKLGLYRSGFCVGNSVVGFNDDGEVAAER